MNSKLIDIKMWDHFSSYIPAAVLDSIENGNNPIEVWRKYRGMTREQLAFQIGISETQIYRIEKGKSKTTQETLEKIAVAVGADLSDFVNPDLIDRVRKYQVISKAPQKI